MAFVLIDSSEVVRDEVNRYTSRDNLNTQKLHKCTAKKSVELQVIDNKCVTCTELNKVLSKKCYTRTLH